jgi:ABC-type sugar transport system ATPase subunit
MAGRIEQIGTPMEVYRNPANRFVAEFIGAPPMNTPMGLSSSSLGWAGKPNNPIALMTTTRPVGMAMRF